MTTHRDDMGNQKEPVPSAIAEQLERFLDDHRTINRRFEPDFMGLGNALQGLFTEASDLTGQIVGIVGLLGDEESGILARLRRMAEGSLENLRSRRQTISANLEAAGAILNSLSSLIAKTSTLERIGLYLRVVGLNFGVESAQSQAATAIFSQMAKDVVQLASKISLVADEIINDCNTMRSGQQEIRMEIVQDLQSLEGLALDAERAVAEAVSRIEQVMGKALSALEGANAHSRTISAQVGEIVMEIQLHDSMSQRIEHIVEALTTVIGKLREAETTEAGMDRDTILAGAWRIVALQGDQVRRIVEEIDAARDKARQAFDLIGSNVQALGHSFASMTADQNHEDSFSFLQNSLTRLSGLMAKASAMIEALRASTSQVNAMVSRLSQQMRSIDDVRFDIHLKAVNAIIKAASLREHGRTLDVLAQESKAIADRAHLFVEEVEVVYRAIDDAARQMQVEDDGTAGGSAPGEELSASVLAINETMTRFSRDSGSCSQQAERLRETIAKTSDGLDFLERLAGELRGHHQQLIELAEAMAPWRQQFNDQELDEDAIRLMQRYTTDQERELHAAFLGIGVGAGGKEAVQEAALAETDDILFFGDAPPAEAEKKEDLADNVELF